MKTILVFLFALVAAAAAAYSATSYDKVDLGTTFTSRMVARMLLGAREDCSGLCVIHYGESDSCGVGYIHEVCEDIETSIGQFEDGCHCCVID